MSKPNIILLMTDQQRYDTIGALGYQHIHTSNIDRLTSQGVSFEQCYCASPACVPSRAAFFQANYPHCTGVLSNDHFWGHSWVELLHDGGYHTVNIGKMHTIPFNATCGFDERFVVENKDRKMRLFQPHGGFYDEWDKYLNNSGKRKPSRVTYRDEDPNFYDSLGAFVWPLEEQFHSDVFVGNMARWFIEQRQSDSPLFLQVGFPGPHPPYDPPARVLQAYKDVKMPVPKINRKELERQPPPHKTFRKQMMEANHDAVHWKEFPSEDQLQRLWRHYMANVTLIDEQVGIILQSLEQKGYLDDAIVVFTSDHGDTLGEHGHIQKWTMYDSVLRVPCMIWAPRYLPSGVRISNLVQQVDLVPMLFELANVDIKGQGGAISALEVIRNNTGGREMVFAEIGFSRRLEDVKYETMVRTKEWKLVHYLDQEWGELYNLQDDPGELHNIWNEPLYSEVRQDLLGKILDWRIRSTIYRSPTG